MAIQITLSLTGFAELNSKLSALEDKVAKRVARVALRKAMKPVLSAARSACPTSVDGSHGNPPGFLRDSIHLRAIHKHGLMGVAVTSGNEKGMFGGDAYYGGFIEFGTNRQPARPFLRPALDSNKEIVLDTLAKELAAGIAAERGTEPADIADFKVGGVVGTGTSLTGRSRLAPPDWEHIISKKSERGLKSYYHGPRPTENAYAGEAMAHDE